MECGDGNYRACQGDRLAYCNEAGEFACRQDPGQSLDIELTELSADALLERVDRRGEDYGPEFRVRISNVGGIPAQHLYVSIWAVPESVIIRDEECGIERFGNSYKVGELTEANSNLQPGAQVDLSIPTQVISRAENTALPEDRYAWFAKIASPLAPGGEENAGELSFCNNYARLPAIWEVFNAAP